MQKRHQGCCSAFLRQYRQALQGFLTSLPRHMPTFQKVLEEAVETSEL